MKQKFIQNQPQGSLTLIGRTAVIVADKTGNIRYEHIGKKNAIESVLLNRLAYAIYTGTIAPINTFGTVGVEDGIKYNSGTVGTNYTIMDSTVVSAATNIPYVIYSGSRTISHNGSIISFGLHNAGLDYATQSGAIAVTSGDTISATWTVSCSTT